MQRFVCIGLMMFVWTNGFAHRASAVDYFWLGGNGNFSDDSKWQDYANPSHHESPGPADSAVYYSSDPAYTVTLDDDYSVNYSAVSGTVGSVYLNGYDGSFAATDFRVGDYDGGGNPAFADNATLLVYGDPLEPLDHLVSNYLTVGGSGTGTLWLYASGRFKSTQNLDGYGIITLGYAASGVGTMYVTDPGSVLDAGGNDVVVGKFGKGTLALYNGGLVTDIDELSIGSESGNANDNAVYVIDAGSLLEVDTIYAGDRGKGQLGVYAGAKVQLTGGILGGSLHVGRLAGVEGTVNVTDAGSMLDASGSAQAIYVGSFGIGTMYVHDDAEANANYFYVGAQAGSQGDVYVYNDALLQVNQLYVGHSGNGALSIDSGGKVEVGVLLDVGSQNSGVGEVNVSGTGSMLDLLDHDTVIGTSGAGALRVSAGGQLVNSNVLGVGGGANAHTNTIEVTGADSAIHTAALSIGFNNSLGDSTVTVADGAHVYVSNTITLGARATLNTAGGAVDATDAVPSATAGTLRVGLNGILTGSGKVIGNVLSVDSGYVIPGSSLGTLTVDGNFTQTSGELFFRIDGPSPAQYSHLNIMGTAAFGGTLNVSIFNGYMPVAGDTFDLLWFVSSSGTFGTVVLPNLSSGLTWNSSQLYSAGILQVDSVSAIAGDYNGDGIVDAADYVVWRKGLGTIYMQSHYNTWRANFGNTLASGSGTTGGSQFQAAVPEPTSGALLLLLCTAIASWTRWRDF